MRSITADNLDISAIRRQALEEAAQVAESRYEAWREGDGVIDRDGLPAVSCDVTACANIAAAIRALAGTPGDEPTAMSFVGRSDYFGCLVEKARAAAKKAAMKFPQPNYVTLKIAEEAGEVVRGAVHYAEGRMDWSEVEGEIVQLLAMLIRFISEGDQINGITPPLNWPTPAAEGGRDISEAEAEAIADHLRTIVEDAKDTAAGQVLNCWRRQP